MSDTTPFDPEKAFRSEREWPHGDEIWVIENQDPLKGDIGIWLSSNRYHLRDGYLFLPIEIIEVLKEFAYHKLQGPAGADLVELVNERGGQALDVPEMQDFWRAMDEFPVALENLVNSVVYNTVEALTVRKEGA